MDNLYLDPSIYSPNHLSPNRKTSPSHQSEVLEGKEYQSVFNNDVGVGVVSNVPVHNHLLDYGNLPGITHHTMYSPAEMHEYRNVHGGGFESNGVYNNVDFGVTAMRQAYYTQQQQQLQLQMEMQMQQQQQQQQAQQQMPLQAHYPQMEYNYNVEAASTGSPSTTSTKKTKSLGSPRNGAKKLKSSSSSNSESGGSAKNVNFFPFVSAPSSLMPPKKSQLATMYPILSKVLACTNPSLCVRRSNKTALAKECISAMLTVNEQRKWLVGELKKLENYDDEQGGERMGLEGNKIKKELADLRMKVKAKGKKVKKEKKTTTGRTGKNGAHIGSPGGGIKVGTKGGEIGKGGKGGEGNPGNPTKKFRGRLGIKARKWAESILDAGNKISLGLGKKKKEEVLKKKALSSSASVGKVGGKGKRALGGKGGEGGKAQKRSRKEPGGDNGGMKQPPRSLPAKTPRSGVASGNPVAKLAGDQEGGCRGLWEYLETAGYFPKDEVPVRLMGGGEEEEERRVVEEEESKGLGRVLNEVEGGGVREGSILNEIRRLEDLEVRTEFWDRSPWQLPGKEHGSRWETYRKRVEREAEKERKGGKKGGKKIPRNPWEDMMQKEVK
ncbi:hypothetical protein TrCOL_g8854 [Triparma columacea]|uniref:Uncharacterized protein n=1 Tax=Triparma columacea TaxID=722753 RepID=A0A9W7GDG0_9STRA|nr:hypothetical protein TrCOL_g8854 [Triparma columacea]